MLSHALLQIQGWMVMFSETQAQPVDDLATHCKFALTKHKVLNIDLTGVLSRASIAYVQALIRYAAGGRADAFCLHLDRALISVGQACVDGINPADELSISGAIVVRDDALALAHHYAARTAESGLVRAVFTSSADALAWSADQAQLARAQQAWVRARRSA